MQGPAIFRKGPGAEAGPAPCGAAPPDPNSIIAEKSRIRKLYESLELWYNTKK